LIEIDAGKVFCEKCEFVTTIYEHHHTIMGSINTIPHIACKAFKTVRGVPRILRTRSEWNDRADDEEEKPMRCTKCKRKGK